MPVSNYMNNSGGLNLTDSPIAMEDNQATGQSFNYDYIKTGSLSKVLGASKLNTVADAQLKSVGLGMYHDTITDTRTLVRAAGTKIQTYDTSSGLITDLADDTSLANTDFLDSSSLDPVNMVAFNTVAAGTQLYMTGAAMTSIKGYNGTKITTNGVVAPTGSIGVTVNPAAGGAFISVGTYYYGIQYRKASTQALSNVALDQSAVIASITDTVTVDLTTITGLDTTLIDQIIIWRSAVNGVSAFTTGSIIARLPSTDTSYTDTGTSIVDTQNTPRSGNGILDNSVLPTAIYKGLTAFKRRLVTFVNSTIYLSDLNKPESWPIVNTITIPSGGPITGVGVIGVPSEYTSNADEYLCIFKDKELWALTGTSPDDWSLVFIDRTGCAGQSLIVSFNGFVSWIGYNGIFLWDGKGRPARCSRPINALFEADGDLDKSNLSQGYACQYEKGNQVQWRVSHLTKGMNKLTIKMDTRLTSLSFAKNIDNPEVDGVFMLDTDSNAYYSICSFKLSSHDELLVAGDDTGFVYQLYGSAAIAVPFQYETKPLDMGNPTILKSFKKVTVYIERLIDKDLTLYFWADYRQREEYRSKVAAPMTPTKGQQPALWDIALWDQAIFDDYVPDITPLEFNLHSDENNSTGISLKLRFEQLDANAPVRIHGFAVEWQPMVELSTPSQQVS